MLRLFIAIELPRTIKDALAELRLDIDGARWTPVDQLHLTLAFPGEVNTAICEILKRRLAEISIPAFKLLLTDGGCFPGRRRPRVLWVGVEPEPALALLANLLRDEIRACGIEQEERPFHPHVTLARLKLATGVDVDGFLVRARGKRYPVIPVHEFVLFESRLRPQGAEHSPLARFRLRA